jgi:hypothetical protein
VDTKELETLDPLHYNPVDVNGGLFGCHVARSGGCGVRRKEQRFREKLL